MTVHAVTSLTAFSPPYIFLLPFLKGTDQQLAAAWYCVDTRATEQLRAIRANLESPFDPSSSEAQRALLEHLWRVRYTVGDPPIKEYRP